MNLIQKQVLENGVTVLVDPSSRFDSVAYAVCILGGLRDETPKTVGLTHTLEHMLFKRTEKKSTKDIANTIDGLGGDINALTDSESLCLYGTVPSSQIKFLVWFLQELCLQTAFTEQDVATEKEVIRQEILESEDDPEDSVYQRFSEKFWPDSLLGKPVFGSTDTLQTFTKESLEERLGEILLGRRIIIAAAGNITLADLLPEIEASFGQLPSGERPFFDAPKTSIGVSLLSRPVTQSYFALGRKWPSILEEDYLTGTVLASLLGSGMSSRLFQLLREQRGLAYEIDASIDGYRDTAGLLVTGTVERKNLDLTLELIFRELKSLQSGGVTSEEVERTVQMLSSQAIMEADALPDRLWRLVETESLYGRFVSIEEELQKLQAVSLQRVSDFIQKWFQGSGFLLVLGGDIDEYFLGEEVAKSCYHF